MKKSTDFESFQIGLWRPASSLRMKMESEEYLERPFSSGVGREEPGEIWWGKGKATDCQGIGRSVPHGSTCAVLVQTA